MLGNRAKPSITYVNGQLSALYKNAAECASTHQRAPDIKPEARELTYGIALSRFYYGEHQASNPTTDDLSFYASFGRPEVEFLCNHEVILHLKLNGGHYYLHPEIVTPRTDYGSKRILTGQEVAFRIPFSEKSSQIENEAIGQIGLYDLNYIILETEKATFCDELFKQPDSLAVQASAEDIEALKTYLARYLELLKRAGYHVFYTLPDFDDVTGSDPINYSLATQPNGVDILSITVEQMTTYLKARWMEAAYLSDKTPKIHYLAEDTGAVDDTRVYVSFRAPIVKALCKHEVALILDIREVNFVKAATDEHKYTNWKIAFVISTDLEHSTASQELRIRVSTARFYGYLSTTSNVFTVQEKHFHDLLITYLREAYLERFESIHHALIYDSTFVAPALPLVKPKPEDTEGGCWAITGCPHAGSNGHVCWGPVINGMVNYSGRLPYDFVTSVTQGALNWHWSIFWGIAAREVTALGKELGRLHAGHALARFMFRQGERVLFDASFKTPQIQLVCAPGSRAAIVYIHLERGMLRTLGERGEYDVSAPDYQFGEWRVSFRVPLEMRQCTADSELPEFVRTHFGRADYRNFKQLVLNFQNAKFSDIESLEQAGGDDDVLGLSGGERRRALLYYLKTHYFQALSYNRHHILHTIPVGVSANALAITSLDFQIQPIPILLTDQYRDGLNGRYDRNAILFLGMTEHRPLPSPSPYPFWITAGFGETIPSATAVLTREIAVDSVIVPLLSTINRDMTVVIGSPRFERGTWVPDVATWGQPELQRQDDCKFSLVAVKDGVCSDSLDFEWSNVENWRYQRGAVGTPQSTWGIDCSTQTKLSIPTGTVSGACVLRLDGRVTLKLEADVKGVVNGRWLSEAEGQWSTTITLATEKDGIRVFAPLENKITVNYREKASIASSGNPNSFDATQVLQEQLRTPNITHIVAGLQNVFDGVWGYLFASASDPHVIDLQAGALSARNPVFTKGGHLVLELRQYEVAQSQWRARIPASMSVAGGLAAQAQADLQSATSTSTVQAVNGSNAAHARSNSFEIAGPYPSNPGRDWPPNIPMPQSPPSQKPTTTSTSSTPNASVVNLGNARSSSPAPGLSDRLSFLAGRRTTARPF